MVALMHACDRPEFYFRPYELNYIKMVNALAGLDELKGKTGKSARRVKKKLGKVLV